MVHDLCDRDAGNRHKHGKNSVKVFTNDLSIKDIAYLLRKEKYAREGDSAG
jgi:hypothetical protein